MRTGKDNVAIAALAGVTLLVGGIEGAHADVTPAEIEPFTIGANADISDSLNLTFNKFNSGLGTLTGVKFTLGSNTETTASVEVFPGEFGGEGRTTNISSFEVQVNTPTLGTLFGPQTSEPSAFCFSESSESCSDSASEPSSFNGTFNVPGGNVGDFVGVGTFDATLLYSAFLETSCEGAECFHEGSISWSGSLKVEYTYDPAAAVPEPGTLALFGAGLAGAAVARRRKKD